MRGHAGCQPAGFTDCCLRFLLLLISGSYSRRCRIICAAGWLWAVPLRGMRRVCLQLGFLSSPMASVPALGVLFADARDVQCC